MLRLSKKEVEIIKNTILEFFGESEIYIFGSRIKEKKGGDIDIFVIPKQREEFFKKKIKSFCKVREAFI